MKATDHKEDFLQFIWKFQLFNQPLKTSDGKEIIVFNQGIHNKNEGPDFLEAKMKIGEITWCGSVEVHLKSSNWLAHNHQHHKAYDNTVLHVVWQNDKEITAKDGSVLPTLEIKNLINPDLIEKYKKLLISEDAQQLPCSFALTSVPNIKKQQMVQRVLLERLELKVQKISSINPLQFEDWDELAYRLLVKGFGFKVNEEPFQALSLNLPFKILRNHLNDRIELEALIFGVSGFLNQKNDEYQSHLA
ncbi:MAG: DUF2851 family protein, partial [Cytophagales bacterium]